MENKVNQIMELAKELYTYKEKVILIFAFNGVGKTRLSVEYKNFTKKENEGQQSGVYYNAFSEDLFTWDNDIENDEKNIELIVKKSSLNQYHSTLTEKNIRDEMELYNPKFYFKFNQHQNPEEGIASISFYLKNDDKKNGSPSIKISRGEERIFIWCFFLVLFNIEGLADHQNTHFFIDDPVSSLDDHNIFVTALRLLDLIKKYKEERKIIVTTHHFGLYSILNNWLTKGEEKQSFKGNVLFFLLCSKNSGLVLEKQNKDVVLYHLKLMQMIKTACSDQLESYHYVLLRQLLENIASFLGTAQISYVLDKLGVENANHKTNIINHLSHQKLYDYRSSVMNTEDKEIFIDIVNHIEEKYKFILHKGKS